MLEDGKEGLLYEAGNVKQLENVCLKSGKRRKRR